jgi:ureidoglycolate hydrolase
VSGRYLAVAKPTFSLEQFPTAEDIEVFQIEGDTVVKMEPGVWHAGPMFIVSSSASLKLSSHVKQDANYMDFLSLELSDTNIVDHNTHVYTREGITFSVQLE